MTATAYCYRSGEIRVGLRCPNGAIPLAYGSEYQLRKAVRTRSRPSYGGNIHLVPGVPEAVDEDAGIEAARQFSAWLTKGNALLIPAIAHVTADHDPAGRAALEAP